ncbi:MAG: DUF1801 domain-containing protein [Candidatus Gracilibacteria bacterium]|jgi:uncharacterized protein YdhG (YjbR/CyaY superfamily)|nr:DUF1801 domain-containing protein [Candidatus Gracilibacteria bacterium]
MTKSGKFKTIDEYINNQPKEAQVLLKDLRFAIKNAVPHATELFTYGVPAFSLVEGGKMEEQIMIAGFKNHVGIYPHPTTIEHFTKELIKYKQGKGAIQFPFNSTIPKELIIKMVKYRKSLIERTK